MALKVMRNEIDGWDVVREDEGVALSNHTTREEAIAAAEIRAKEDHIAESGGEPVEVDTEHVHEIDDVTEGVKPAFLGGGTLLLAIILIAAAAAIIAAVTNFGA